MQAGMHSARRIDGESKADRCGRAANPARYARTPGLDKEAAMAQASGNDRYDLAIIGSGGAAFAAAIAARRKDRRVVMVERGRIGGTCVNTGCVPSKALLAAAAARNIAAEAGWRFPGIATTAGPVDPVALVAGKQALVEDLRADKYVDLAAAYGWEVVGGTAHFVADPAEPDGPMLRVDLSSGGTRRIQAAHYLVATGSTPWAPPIPGLEEVGYLTSTMAMELAELPRSLLVVGGNAVGLEQAQLFARLGAKVTVVEVLDRLAPLEEPEVGAAIAAVFADEGITVHAGAQLSCVASDGEGGVAVVVVHRDGRPRQLRAERLLVATGRRPVAGGLGLEAVGVKVGDRGQVVVDERLRTDNPRTWAGDAILAAVYAVKLAMTTTELADTWAPYLTMGEGLRLAAQAFTRDITKLSCCAA